MTFRQEASNRISEMLKSGTPLEEIARMVGGEEFLGYETKGRQSPVLRFDVEKFIQAEIDTGRFLKLPDQMIQLKRMILPPDEGEIIEGQGGGVEKSLIIPRSKYFTEVLTDLNQNYVVITGRNDQRSMRALSYQGFYLPELRKLGLVNDEEGNATFILHNIDLSQETLDRVMALSKNQLKNSKEFQIDYIRYQGDPVKWKEKISECLTVKKEIGPKSEEVPEGWLTIYAAASKLGKNYETIKKRVDEYRESNPEWFQKYRSKRGRTEEFLHPDLINNVEQDLKRYTQAPEGWKTNNQIARGMGINFDFAERLIKEFLSGHPDWKANYLTVTGKIAEFYHPELVKLVEEEIKKRPEAAPTGWVSVGALSGELNSAHSSVKTLADNHRKEHPEWFQNYLGPTKAITEYLHPNLVEIIRNAINSRHEKAPEGWVTHNSIISNFNISSTLLDTILKPYKQEHPEWFGKYALVFNGRVHRKVNYLSPEAVEAVKNYISSRPEKVPDGWLPEKALADKLDVATNVITRIKEQFRQTHPEWFKEYINEQGRNFEYLHPQLIAQIEKILRSRPDRAPDGWMNNSVIADKLGVVHSTVRGIVDKYRAEHPEWFKNYQNNANRTSEFYHPDLLAVIRAEIGNRPEPPPAGWMTVHSIAINLGTYFVAIQKIAEKYRSTNPEGFKLFLDKTKKTAEFLSPDLIQKIQQDFSANK